MKLGALQLGDHDPGDASADLVLQIEDVVELPVVALGPHVMPGLGVDQLRRHANPAATLAHAALDDVARAQFLADLANIGRDPLEGKGRVAGDHRKRLPQRQRGDDVLGQPVREVVLLGITADVLERQHRDGGTLEQLFHLAGSGCGRSRF